MANLHLNNRVAVVTGGTGGIGTAICKRLAKEGAKVVAADRNAPTVDLPEGFSFQSLDVTSEDSVKALMAAIDSQYGQIDILVNAAGIEIEKTIENTSLDDWNNIFAINVTGTFLVSKYALPLIRKTGAGSIINFGSYDGFIADP